MALRGNVHPSAAQQFDRGLVDPQLPMERITMVLKRSPAQEAALQQLMARQLDPKSKDFHHWLEPEEFGAAYGPSDDAIRSVTSWLQNHGLIVNQVSKGRIFIQFSGTAGVVQQVFHTQIHRYNVNGQEHIANSTDPAIPEALSPVVAGIVSLHNFYSRPLHRDLGTFRRDPKTRKWVAQNEQGLTRPLFAVPNGGSTFEMVSPYDFAAIYNVLPLWNAGIDGTGQTIAIAGRSQISLTDVATFRSAFGLPAKPPVIVVNGTDPGVPSAGDKSENTLDVEWSGAVAKNATIKFITTASTNTSDGAVSSAMYIIDNKVAPILSFSYGQCELSSGTAGNTANNLLWQQGAAEGITEFVASGDQGSAACDGGQQAPYGAQHGLAVSGSSTTPYNIAVGGTDLNWANSNNTYWNTTNAANNSSALGYMPEVPWNGSCASNAGDQLIGATAAGLDAEQTCQYLLTNNFDTNLINVVGGTGGKSACTTPTSNTTQSCAGGYAKPSWQTGVGVPADGKRDVPDLSLFASSGTLNSAYVICDSDSNPCTFSDANDSLAQGVGGTSVSSPAMAGIMALLEQKVGAAQGNANVSFYKLAALDNRANCNSNSVRPGNSCNFLDITTDNNSVPCVAGAPDCTVSHTGDQVGILNGYTSNVGYDLATGLGSVNATNLVNNWHLVSSSASKPTVTTEPATNVTTTTATLNGSVNPNGSDTQVWFELADNSSFTGSGISNKLDVGAGTGVLGVSLPLTSLTSNAQYYYRLNGSSSGGTVNGSAVAFTTTTGGTPPGGSALRFVAIAPCRVVDTRGATGAFGGPQLAAGSTREFDLPQGGCGIPTTAVAYSLNVTVVPNAALTYLTLWPAREAQPNVSTLNSDGRVKANAAITPAGANGGVSVFASDATQMILDIDGYFVPATTASALAFYPVTPCRVADTRSGIGPLAGPFLPGNSSRSFPVQSSTCGIPASAAAYSLNITALPHATLNYLTTWPSGQAQPNVSTLNSSTGAIAANAAIVPVGSGGGTSVFVSDAADVILDVNGYFAPPATGGLSLYTLTPCRVLDTRGASGLFNGVLSIPVAGSSCAAPAAAQAYVLNATVVPSGGLIYLSLWPAGQTQPNVSTLNANDGAITSNLAILPTANGSVDAFSSNPTQLILDISSYFAP